MNERELWNEVYDLIGESQKEIFFDYIRSYIIKIESQNMEI